VSFPFTSEMFGTAAAMKIFSGPRTVHWMLAFEAALARAQAQSGVIPSEAAASIERVCGSGPIDLGQLTADSLLSANAAAPLVKQLTAAVAQHDPEAAKFVHWGATSQDTLDTALVLQLRESIASLRGDLDAVVETLAQLTAQHQSTPMAGRTLLQQALPMTFGFKVAGWLDAAMRHQDRLRALEEEVSVLQLGGAAGTLASLGDHAQPVMLALARFLDLRLPDIPWHTQRDRLASVATTCGLLVGTLGKIAGDIALSSQTEVGELAEPAEPGKGGSSTLPHKRNLVGCNYVIAVSMRVPNLVATMLSAMAHEHERAAGAWHAEWEVLPEILRLTAGGLLHLKRMMGGLEVNAQRMRENLDITRGQLMAECITIALGSRIGRMRAYQLVNAACRKADASGVTLRETLCDDPELSALIDAAEMDRLLDPSNYLGQSQVFARKVLECHRQRAGR
jgi:3-carboxy-cis,cis-muconate cycloisomerase